MPHYTPGATITQEVTATVAGQADVVVCGGGTAGCVAALAAARNGADVLLVEAGHCLGGMMTEGNAGLTKFVVHGAGPAEQAAIVRPLRDRPAEVQVVGGIPLEIVHRLLEMGAAVGTGGTAGCYVFTDSEAFKLLLYDMAVEAGVRLALHSPVCDVLAAGERLDGVVTQTKQGRRAYLGQYLVDATGDGDVAALAGVPFVLGVGPGDAVYQQGLAPLGQLQAMGAMFRIGGVDLGRYLNHLRRHPDQFVVQHFGLMSLEEVLRAHDSGEMAVFMGTTSSGRRFQVYNYPRPGIVVGCISAPGNRDGLTVEDRTASELDVLVQARDLVAQLRADLPGFEAAFVLDTPRAGVRETRHVQGEYALDVADIVASRQFPDTIGKGGHPVDISPRPREVEEAEARDGWYFDIPYRILVAAGRDNLLLAGRCTSATREAAGSLRPTAACMVMGQAAGTAAALLCGTGRAARDLDVDQLRQRLQEQGAVI